MRQSTKKNFLHLEKGADVAHVPLGAAPPYRRTGKTASKNQTRETLMNRLYPVASESVSNHTECSETPTSRMTPATVITYKIAIA